jgi:pimeloyl-ACP methyl ester carboxylesterase
VDVSVAERSLVVRTGRLPIRVVVWGRDEDPPVVLVHGNGAHAHWFVPIVPALVPGRRVIALDLRGHGESGWPDVPDYGMAQFASDLACIVDALVPGPFALIGHSMGGRVALRYTVAHAERVRVLGILDSRIDPVVPGEAGVFRGKGDGPREGRGYPSYADAAAAFRFVPDEPGVPPDVVAMLASHAIVERGSGDWTYRFDRAVLRFSDGGSGDMTPLLRRVSCPTLVANGRDSWVLDRGARERAVAAVPHGQGLEFPGAHHFLLSHAAETGRALRVFLDRHAA